MTTTFTFLSTRAGRAAETLRGRVPAERRSVLGRGFFALTTIAAVSALFLLLSPTASLAADRDVFVSGLVLYAKIAPDSVEAKEHGKYPRLARWDRHGGLAPEKVDAVGLVNGPELEVTVLLEVLPVVGLTNWQATEGITDSQLLESSKTMLPSMLRLERTIRLKGRTEVKFSDVDLGRLIRYWRDKGYWPAEFVFRLSVEPASGETALVNNVMEFRLAVRPPD